ncbi:hypothetical protein [Marinicellulosiphila megalodicopiae]|uniref:hypothetical protein n=1 Tax=Marinicellulosiphila megalodicopiae TaxID=2724896 RepID=UPI003BAF1AFB
MQEIKDTLIQDIRECTNKYWVLGTSKFIEQIEQQLNIQAKPKPKGGKDPIEGPYWKDPIGHATEANLTTPNSNLSFN